MRCLIVDDNARFLAAARQALKSDDLTVVGVASNSAEALGFVEELRPDVVLVDIELGTESGFDLAHRLNGSGSSTAMAVILISTHAEEDFADMIQASPVVGFIPKSALTPARVRSMVGSSARLKEGEHG